jgi:hypothetical protein
MDDANTEAKATAPTNVEDLEKRVKLLREQGVRAYKDGPLEIIFAPPAPRVSENEKMFAEFQALEAASSGAV